MKFTQALLAVMAVATQAQPIEEPRAAVQEFPVLASSPQALDARSLEARAANMQFIVWPNINCESSPNGLVVSAGEATAKGNFSPAQKSIKLVALNAGYHVSIYTDSNQQPSGSPNLRLNAGNVGNCWNYSPGWKSWGLYTGA